MDWHEWHKQYDALPSLQTRLRIVREQIAAALEACPPGPIQVVSVCAGDGRDVIGALADHPRRKDVTAALLDNHAESIARGRAAAQQASLAAQLRYVQADAAVAGNYQGYVPADLVLLSGFLGHLRHEDIPRLIASLPMLCKAGGCAIWSRHVVLHEGRQQVPAIRELFRQNQFEEVHFENLAPDGFAVGRARFAGRALPLDPPRVMFEFVGLDRLLAVPLPPPANRLTQQADFNPAGGEAINRGPAGDHFDQVEQSIPARFEEVAARHSSRIALGSGAWQPTYGELNAVANGFAQVLILRGGTAGDRVALLLRHDTPLVAVALAALKAGKVIVVLNPADPPARLREILEDADPACIVTDRAHLALAEQVAGPTRPVLGFEALAQGPTQNPKLGIPPEAVAVLLYTSGSTGRPKGVMQTHRNILHNVLRLSRGMELRAEDRVVLLASLSGGQGLATTWCALLNGAALCPFATMENGVVGLAGWLKEHQITVYVSSASVFRHFMGTVKEAEGFPAVRLVRLASEPATARDFVAYRRHFTDGCILFSTLSSSETGNITQHRFTKGDSLAQGRLPVGWPAAGMEIQLLDEQGREVRHGEVGEIVVRSRYLSPGYWRNELLTAERFSRGPGPRAVRLFRSGDRGRRLPDGALLFMGRADSQVKIRGYRVELTEIEEALAQQPGVERAVVCARATPNNVTQLVAYVVSHAGRLRDAQALKRELRKVLPGYLVPASFVFLDTLPITPHGKIDRQALPPPPDPDRRAPRVRKPRDVVERNLARIFESVLGRSSVGRRDDFFDLGGTSLQSVEVLTAIEEVFDVVLPPSALIEHSTVEQLAPLLSDRAVVPSSRPLVVLRPGQGGQPLFLVHSGQGDVLTYGLLVRKLRDRPVYGLQAVGLQGESWPLMTIPAMAERYLPEILAREPVGPYLLAGTCMGGIVAFELAQRLVRLGRAVNLVALMDSPAPPYSGRRARWHEAVLDPLRDVFRMLRWGLARVGGFNVTGRQLPAYRRFVAGMTGRANRRYRPGFYPGTITLLLTTGTEFPAGDRRRLMARYARQTRTIALPGTRPGLFVRPAVDELARQLQGCLDLAADPMS